MLLIAMTVGAGAYLAYHACPRLHHLGGTLEEIATTAQPCLLFAMLFLTFCKIEPRDLRPSRWQWWLLVVQCGIYAGISLLLYRFPSICGRLALETVMLCMICPTATACAVVTGKLGGNMAGVLTYTILINLAVSVLIPLMVPLTHPVGGLDFFTAFTRILAKVFPLLIMPCLTAWIVRFLLPKIHAVLLQYVHVSFYIWAVSLTLAIAMSTRGIVHHADSAVDLAVIAASSLLCCIFQFWAGKKIGGIYGSRITAGQSLGQKNTVFAIWVGYTFMNPLVSVAGGFYSLWHNCFNTWQLYKVRVNGK